MLPARQRQRRLRRAAGMQQNGCTHALSAAHDYASMANFLLRLLGRLDDVHELGLQGGAAHLASAGEHASKSALALACNKLASFKHSTRDRWDGAGAAVTPAASRSSAAGIDNPALMGCMVLAHAKAAQTIDSNPSLTRKPSMSGWVARSPQLAAVTAQQ